MVLRAGKKSLDLGGHIASFASAATLYDVGFNHFWRAPTKDFGGDLVYFQGHSSPGIYARAFLEGRLSETQLDMFRQEVDGGGLSSYPHPWLMPDFWQFPTVSMGLGPIQAIYQARFLRYLHHRGLADTEGRKVWAFMGDGEMDEPESRGALNLAPREGLDNLIFVINCNLQRLDGPVRGNGKIIQELESDFAGAGWNVIKVVWGAYWDPLMAQDKDGMLLKRMEECVDGEYQKFKSRDGAYVRENFFGKYPELQAMVAQHVRRGDLAPQPRRPRPAQGLRCVRGGREAHGAADGHPREDRQGLRHGRGGRGEEHRPPAEEDGRSRRCAQFRDRFKIPIPDDKLAEMPYYRPAPDSPEMKYLQELRGKLGGSVPQRRRKSVSLDGPQAGRLQASARGHGGGARDLDHHGLRAHC